MLDSIDVLIGLTVILLALSMAVTVITQSITTIVNSRGRHLRRGLTDLLQQLDPALTEPVGRAVATSILTHPLVSGSSVPLSHRARLGNVVHREEFTKLLMGLAAGQGTASLDDDAKTALVTALKNNGVQRPGATLESIRTLSLELERTAPELASMARQNTAILHAAQSDLVAKINNWFDQSMDRTSQRFTASTRAITFAGAFIVAFGLQVDTPSIVNRLAADDQLRAAFVQQAEAIQVGQQAQGGTGTDAGQGTDAAVPEAVDRQYREFLAENGIIRLPSARGWTEGFGLSSCLGMLLTALLLSLGAPFWYGALGRLLQLRSVLAVKEAAQRTARQSNDAPPAGPGTPARAAVPAWTRPAGT